MREIVLDTETTGLSAKNGHKIIEIGAIELENKTPTGSYFHVYINPQRGIEEEAVKIHKIKEDFLLDKPIFKQITKEFLSFIGTSAIIIHNATFDLSFLNAELLNCNLSVIDNEIIDTLVEARKIFHGAHVSLDALCKKYNISISNRKIHGALIDAALLCEVYIELKGGKQQKLDLNLKKNINSKRKELIATNSENKNKHTDIYKRDFKPSEEELRKHKEFIKDLKNPIWKKYLQN